MSERYEIKEKIGQGGLGEVYRALDTQLKREVALKRIKPDKLKRGDEGGETGTEDAADQLLNEATTLSALQHPNIVTVYDVGKDDKGAFVVMELLKGETFDATIDRSALTEEDFRRVVSQTIEALIAAQDVDIVHRDLKPSNLMVIWLPSGKFQIKILDFGLAKFSHKPSVQTMDQADAIYGSIYFMAPEQFERVPLDARTDLYAMGCMYYQALAQRHPFDGDTAAQVMASHLQNRVVPLHTLRPDIPAWMSDWIMWLIRRDMDARPADAKQAFEFFNEERSGIQLSDETSSGAPSQPTQVITPHTAAPVPGAPVMGTASQPLQGYNPTVPLAEAAAQPGLAPKKKFPVPMWAMVTFGLLLATVVFLGVRRSGQSKRLTERHERAQKLNATDNPEGDAETVQFVLKYITDFRDEDPMILPAMLDTLGKLKGADVDDAIVSSISRVPKNMRLNMLQLVQVREIKAALPKMIAYLDDKYPQKMREQATYVIGALGDYTYVYDLLKQLAATDSATVRKALSIAIIQICSRETDPARRVRPILADFEDSEGEHRAALLDILGTLGGEKAWAVFEEALHSNDNDTRRGAMRALINWPDHRPADKLYELATTAEDKLERSLAAGVFVRVVHHPSDKDPATRAQQLEALLKQAIRSTEQKQLFFALSRIPHQASLDIVKKYEGDPKTGKLAAFARGRLENAIKRLVPVSGDVTLTGAKARAEGNIISYSERNDAIIDWIESYDRVEWLLDISKPGRWKVALLQAAPVGYGGAYEVRLGESMLTGSPMVTDSESTFETVEIGEVEVTQAGVHTLSITAQVVHGDGDTGLMRLRSVTLTAQ